MASYTIKYGDTLSGIAAQTGKSMQELLQLNPSIVDPNKIYAGRTLDLGSSAPAAPTPTPTTTNNQKQTIAQVAKVTVPDYTADPTTTQIGNNYKSQATQTVDEDAIRAATRARIQGQIDAINAAVADQIANFRNTTGKNREGQAYALAAAGGRTGSATGESEIQSVENMNDQEANTYQDDANNKIASLLGAASKDATDEINAKRTAIEQGAEKYLEFLDNQGAAKKDQVTAFVKNMLAVGVDPTQLSDADFQKLQDQYGFTRDQLTSMYNDAKATAATATVAADKAKIDSYGTGAIGEYNYYADNERAAGRTPVSFNEYQNMDANRKIEIAKASSGGLTANETQTTVNGIVNQFDNEPVVKNYNVVAEGYQFAKTLVGKTNPTSSDDQGLIYAFAKAMDPNSVVREGEYATVQKYAQSWAQSFGFKAERIFSNEPFLSPDARQNMLSTIQQKYTTSRQNYDNVSTEYTRRINDAKSGKISGSITDYGAAYSDDTPTSQAGQTGTLPDGRKFIVGDDGETLLDPTTKQPLQ